MTIKKEGTSPQQSPHQQSPPQQSKEERTVFPIVMVGSMDHGKSTLIGRLLYDTGSLTQERQDRIKKLSDTQGGKTEWSFLLDGLRDERKYGRTIESTQVRFSTEKRTYQLIDAPGHIDYLRNMVTSASLAEAAILLLDVTEGVAIQTKRHAYILALMGVGRIIVAINKMDKVDDQRPFFDKRVQECQRYFEETLGLTVEAYIPISAFCGTNLVEKSSQMPWYQGKSLLEFLEDFPAPISRDKQSLRCVVQDVYWDSKSGERAIALRVRAGTLTNLDKVKILESGKVTEVRHFKKWRNKEKEEKGANFGGKNLEGANLEGVRGANLERTILEGANLERVNLRQANLEGANLREAHLFGAHLFGANLREANLEGANLREANLREAHLERANLIEAHLFGANLEGANLREANLREANLEGANLREAHLFGAHLFGANLREANLEGANLREANLREANLERANLEGAHLREANLERANLIEANLIEAYLEGAHLEGANFFGADLERADLEGAHLDRAVAGDCVTVLINDNLAVDRGATLVSPDNTITLTEEVMVQVFWLADKPLSVGDPIEISLDTATVPALVKRFDAVLNTETTKRRKNATNIQKNEAARIQLLLSTPLPLPTNTPGDEGRIVLRINGQIVAGGLLLQEVPEERHLFPQSQKDMQKQKRILESRQSHQGGVLWMTGLSGAGKSTIASSVEEYLLREGYLVTVIDGDTLRAGLCSDLGFSTVDRAENMRRAAHLARILAERGFLVLMSLISPLRSERIKAKDLVGNAFREIYIQASLETCEKRDTKGLYKKARNKQIEEFTGISAPYDVPRAPDLRIPTQEHTPTEAKNLLIKYIKEHFS